MTILQCLLFFILMMIAFVIAARELLRDTNDYETPHIPGILLIILSISILIGDVLIGNHWITKNYTNITALYKEGKAVVYIDGEPTSNKFDIDGVNLDDYFIKVDNNKIYLTRKRRK